MVEDLQKMFKVSTKPIKKAPFWGSMILAWEENLRCVKPHPVARVTSSHNERLDNLKRIFIQPKYWQKEIRQAGDDEIRANLLWMLSGATEVCASMKSSWSQQIRKRGARGEESGETIPGQML